MSAHIDTDPCARPLERSTLSPEAALGSALPSEGSLPRKPTSSPSRLPPRVASRTSRTAQAHEVGHAVVPRPRFPMLLTVSEVAEVLRTTNKAVYAMVERGQLAGTVRRIHRRVLFDQAALVAWLSETSGAPSPEGDRR